MSREISSPLAEYSDFYRDEHLRVATEFFDQLVKDSGIDVEAHKSAVDLLRAHQSSEREWKSLRARWVLLLLGFIATLAGLSVLSAKQHVVIPYLVAVFVAIAYFFVRAYIPNMSLLRSQVKQVAQMRDDQEKVCWNQMAPVNQRFRWGIARSLVSRSFPELELDGYVSVQRLQDMVTNYGLNGGATFGRSVLFTQAGAFKRNPFVITRTLRHWMGSKTYTGSIVITWYERQRNADGQWVSVRRTQTLFASVTRDFPEYATDCHLFFGHENVPELSFTRGPSRISGGATEGQIERKAKKVERMGRKQVKKGTGNLTVMANREFEALFHAVDRSDEVQFRMLFTPSAQEEMVKLLKDRQFGPGDDFAYGKVNRFNIIQSKNLASAQLDDFPSTFKSYDLWETKRKFTDFNVRYFRALYFALAPLLTSPLYRDERSIPELGSEENHHLSDWEHEALAYWMGEANFAHPASATQNLLRAEGTRNADGTANVKLTASGYSANPRMTIIPVFGNDGHWHDVPVAWTEYLPVTRTRQMVSFRGSSSRRLADQLSEDAWAAAAKEKGLNPANCVVKGGIGAGLA